MGLGSASRREEVRRQVGTGRVTLDGVCLCRFQKITKVREKCAVTTALLGERIVTWCKKSYKQKVSGKEKIFKNTVKKSN